MDHRGVEQLPCRQGRQDAGQAARQHRLAGPGRPAEQQVVAARRRDLQRPAGLFLALDVPQVRPGRALLQGAGPGRTQHLDSPEVVDQADQGASRQDRHLPRPGRLRPAGLRTDETEPQGTGGHGSGQGPGAGRQPTVEAELAEGQPSGQGILRNHADGGHQRQGDGQIVVAALLGHVGGGEIDHQPLGRKGEAQAGERRPHPLPALGHGLVPQADEDEGHEAGTGLDLHIHPAGVNTLERSCDNARRHPCLLLRPASRMTGTADLQPERARRDNLSQPKVGVQTSAVTPARWASTASPNPCPPFGANWK